MSIAVPSLTFTVSLALLGLSESDSQAPTDGRATMDVQGKVGYDVNLEDGKVEGQVYYRDVMSPVSLEATGDGWRGTVARFDVVTAKVSDVRFELELTPIFGDDPTPSPMPREPYARRFQFEVTREEDGSIEYRGWSGMRDRQKLHAHVSLDEGRLWVSAGDGESDRTIELRRENMGTGAYRGTRLDVIASSGTLPFDRDVRLTSSGALELASLLEDDPVLFSILYVVFPTLPQFSW